MDRELSRFPIYSKLDGDPERNVWCGRVVSVAYPRRRARRVVALAAVSNFNPILLVFSLIGVEFFAQNSISDVQLRAMMDRCVWGEEAEQKIKFLIE